MAVRSQPKPVLADYEDHIGEQACSTHTNGYTISQSFLKVQWALP